MTSAAGEGVWRASEHDVNKNERNGVPINLTVGKIATRRKPNEGQKGESGAALTESSELGRQQPVALGTYLQSPKVGPSAFSPRAQLALFQPSPRRAASLLYSPTCARGIESWLFSPSAPGTSRSVFDLCMTPSLFKDDKFEGQLDGHQSNTESVARNPLAERLLGDQDHGGVSNHDLSASASRLQALTGDPMLLRSRKRCLGDDFQSMPHAIIPSYEEGDQGFGASAFDNQAVLLGQIVLPDTFGVPSTSLIPLPMPASDNAANTPDASTTTPLAVLRIAPLLPSHAAEAAHSDPQSQSTGRDPQELPSSGLSMKGSSQLHTPLPAHQTRSRAGARLRKEQSTEDQYPPSADRAASGPSSDSDDSNPSGKANYTSPLPGMMIEKEGRQCNCKKSQCLKLYCDCFSAQMYCYNCSCMSCMNTTEFASLVHEKQMQIKSRDPLAFELKIQANMGKAQHKKGCNCKRSSCLKKYCECFQGNVPCGATCKCVDCKNYIKAPTGTGRRGRGRGAAAAARQAALEAAAAAAGATAADHTDSEGTAVATAAGLPPLQSQQAVAGQPLQLGFRKEQKVLLLGPDMPSGDAWPGPGLRGWPPKGEAGQGTEEKATKQEQLQEARKSELGPSLGMDLGDMPALQPHMRGQIMSLLQDQGAPGSSVASDISSSTWGPGQGLVPGQLPEHKQKQQQQQEDQFLLFNEDSMDPNQMLCFTPRNASSLVTVFSAGDLDLPSLSQIQGLLSPPRSLTMQQIQAMMSPPRRLANMQQLHELLSSPPLAVAPSGRSPEVKRGAAQQATGAGEQFAGFRPYDPPTRKSGGMQPQQLLFSQPAEACSYIQHPSGDKPAAGTSVALQQQDSGDVSEPQLQASGVHCLITPGRTGLAQQRRVTPSKRRADDGPQSEFQATAKAASGANTQAPGTLEGLLVTPQPCSSPSQRRTAGQPLADPAERPAPLLDTRQLALDYILNRQRPPMPPGSDVNPSRRNLPLSAVPAAIATAATAARPGSAPPAMPSTAAPSSVGGRAASQLGQEQRMAAAAAAPYDAWALPGESPLSTPHLQGFLNCFFAASPVAKAEGGSMFQLNDWASDAAPQPYSAANGRVGSGMTSLNASPLKRIKTNGEYGRPGSS